VVVLTPVEILPGVHVVEDLISDGLMSEIVSACDVSQPFRATEGATLYRDVLLPHISEPLSRRFDAWLHEVCVPIITECLGVELTFYEAPWFGVRFLQGLGVLNDKFEPPSRIEKLLHLRGLRKRFIAPKLTRSPQTFVTKYAEETQRATGIHRDRVAGASLVLNLNEDYDGGGTYFADYDTVVRPPRGSGVIFSGRNMPHRGEPVLRGCRYITTTWFHV
jgi:hypothetical protein